MYVDSIYLIEQKKTTTDNTGSASYCGYTKGSTSTLADPNPVVVISAL